MTASFSLLLHLPHFRRSHFCLFPSSAVEFGSCFFSGDDSDKRLNQERKGGREGVRERLSICEEWARMSWIREEDNKQWGCGKAGAVNLQRVGSIVRDLGEPCLSQSPIKVVLTVAKMLKPDKWHSIFDSDGKVSGFHKVLKLIVLGGVDPSIRAEVWEFLLGCYELGSTAEYRRQLRIARRERYEDLVKQCRMMHSSIGTGTLAFVVGSKVMDMRTSCKDDVKGNAKVERSRSSSHSNNKLESQVDLNNNCTDTSYTCEKECSRDSAELASVRGSTDSAAYDSSCFIPTSGPCNTGSPKTMGEARLSEFIAESFYDFPPLPFTDLFGKSEEDNKEYGLGNCRPSSHRRLRFEDDQIHSFQIDNNVDLVIESNGSPSNSVSHLENSEIEVVCHDEHDLAIGSKGYKNEIVDKMRVADVPEAPMLNAVTSNGGADGEHKVSEWLWTLHRIVVDVVRTDSHLEFYEDTRNLARMSDILAVYAWVDPGTGYCQGMSDLLSPFVVLFDDDADAFWCFEMLLRRMRENFQMEGPTGVMKQLQALWHIMELIDREIYRHLLHIGAESLHFAFRMLMVLFRRELSFSEALRMWEMMWAADFDETMTSDLEENCPEALVLDLHRDSDCEIREESMENGNGSSRNGSQVKHETADLSVSDNSGINSSSVYPFCGFTRSFWSKDDHLQISSIMSSTKNGDDELPVFCVAAILIMNRQKIIRETHSIDDMIKIFNDKLLKIHVRRCIHSAIKLRKKYFYKLIKRRNIVAQSGD